MWIKQSYLQIHHIYLEAILWCTSVLLNCIYCFLDCFEYVHATSIAVFISFLIMGNNKSSLPCCRAHFAVCFNQMLYIC